MWLISSLYEKYQTSSLFAFRLLLFQHFLQESKLGAQKNIFKGRIKKCFWLHCDTWFQYLIIYWSLYVTPKINTIMQMSPWGVDFEMLFWTCSNRNKSFVMCRYCAGRIVRDVHCFGESTYIAGLQNLKTSSDVNYTDAIGNPEQHVRNASHRGSKQQ